MIAAKDLEPAAYQAFVAEKMTAIFLACAFQDLTTQRARRIQSTLHTVERRLSRLASKLGTREIPYLVDYWPQSPGSWWRTAPPRPARATTRPASTTSSRSGATSTGAEPDVFRLSGYRCGRKCSRTPGTFIGNQARPCPIPPTNPHA